MAVKGRKVHYEVIASDGMVENYFINPCTFDIYLYHDESQVYIAAYAPGSRYGAERAVYKRI